MLFVRQLLFLALSIKTLQSNTLGIRIYRDGTDQFSLGKTCPGVIVTRDSHYNMCHCNLTSNTFYEKKLNLYCSPLEDIRKIEGKY